MADNIGGEYSWAPERESERWLAAVGGWQRIALWVTPAGDDDAIATVVAVLDLVGGVPWFVLWGRWLDRVTGSVGAT